MFNGNFRFRLSCGDEMTRVFVCHPPSRRDHISLSAQSPRHPRFYSSTARTYASSTHINTQLHTDPVFLCGAATWQESIFILFNIALSLLLGLNHVFTVSVGGSLGHVVHLPIRTILGSQVSGWFVWIVRLSQRWKGLGRTRPSELQNLSFSSSSPNC